MNQDKIIEMAREAGVYLTKIGYEFDTDDLCHFAALVAAHEREVCAKVCEELGKANRDAFAQYDCAASIRARDEK